MTVSRHKTEEASTLALSTESRRFLRPMAAVKATRAMRCDLAFFVNHRVERDGFAIFLVAAFGRAEIDAAGQLAHAEHIEAAGDEFLFDRRGVGEGGQADARAEVGEEAEVFAQRQQRAALGLEVGWQVFPLRAADRAEQNGVRLFAGLHGFRRQRVAGGIDGRAADEMFGAGNREAELARSTASRMRTASAMTSGPMPSPARIVMR